MGRVALTKGRAGWAGAKQERSRPGVLRRAVKLLHHSMVGLLILRARVKEPGPLNQRPKSLIGPCNIDTGFENVGERW
ncbi:hypothetical protein PAHAL_9G116200 [Panicum hallii]|uniref:Uncharacterized protein n=1 Tax=Panicum hallii TaxID=206008 RepID=A0A2S3IIW1_9POAL|nr:hypothetical protein PAHAL_9G116200 [Panicum hallii]